MPTRRLLTTLATVLLLVAGCGSSDNDDPGPTTTTKAKATTTAPKGKAEGADAAKLVAVALHAAWKADDKAAAAEVADEAAVDTLFAEAYSEPDQSFYGCGGKTGAFTCVYYDDDGGYQYMVEDDASGTYRVVEIKTVPSKE